MPEQIADLFIETILAAFIMGGIIGTALGLSLKTDPYWQENKEKEHSAEIIPIGEQKDTHGSWRDHG